MSDIPYVPQKTRDELAASHPEGTRHAAMIKIAMALLGNNFSEAAVFAELRSKFPAEKTNKEIQDVISWCADKNPTPSGFGMPANRPAIQHPRSKPSVAPKAVEKPKESHELVAWWLNGRESSVEEFRQQSPVTLNGHDAALSFLHLYDEKDHVNIVCQFTLNDKGKANPSGGGKILSRQQWLDWFNEKGTPQREAGAWIRMNPCLPMGTGKNGSIKDSDITSLRYLLVESDTLPVAQQLAFYSKLRLPIAALISSGAKSVHAWVRVDAKTPEEYDATALRVFTALEPFGFDQSNKNPSRLSRLPGSTRTIGAVDGGVQRLLYLNPSVAPLSESELEKFEASLQRPLPNAKPFKQLFKDGLDRYEILYANRGKLGVQVGLREFDRDTGGLKGGQMTVIAAGTNGGKSSMCLNMIRGACANKHGVALFTLEMDRDEINDLMVTMHCYVDRNVFNTGYFDERDFLKITSAGERVANLPLWVFDDPTYTVSQIEEEVMALHAHGLISLVVIDYAQIVAAENESLSREQQVATVARAIRILAKKTKLPFVVLSQLNDEGKLRESRVVAHEAHTVIILEIEGEKGRQMRMKVVKGRSIQKKEYVLNYDPFHCMIEDPLPSEGYVQH